MIGKEGRAGLGEPTNGESQQTSRGGIFKPSMPPVAQPLGQWEKHTKGIGTKLLQKFGFKGRLGAREDGVSAAIEVVKRPEGQGLGFGGFKEASTLKTNRRIEAEWRGEEYVEEDESDDEQEEWEGNFGGGLSAMMSGKKRRKVNVVEQIAQSESWKQGKEGLRPKPKVINAADFLMQKDKVDHEDDNNNENNKMKIKIIDMRGAETRILDDASEIGTYGATDTVVNLEDGKIASRQPKLGEELLYNINLIVGMLEIDVVKASRECANEKRRLETMNSERIILQAQLERDEPRLERLEKIMAILTRVQDKQNENPASITVEAVVRLFQTLYDNFCEEFRMFSLLALLPTIISPVLASIFNEWINPLSQPHLPSTTLSPLVALIQYFEAKGEVSLTVQATNMLESLVDSIILPNVRRCITNEWDVRDADPCIDLIESLQSILPNVALSRLLESFILPRIVSAVDQWQPSTDATLPPLHTWTLCWLPLLTKKLSVIYPEVRRKLHRVLTSSSWHPSNTASMLAILRPWVEVFDQTSSENLIVRSVMPKLVCSLRELKINDKPLPTEQLHSNPLYWAVSWCGAIPPVHMNSLLIGEFFPRWLRTLGNWLLCNPPPSLSLVFSWYESWKACFPPELMMDKEVIQFLVIATDMISASLAGATGLELLQRCMRAMSEVESSYVNVLEFKLKELHMKQLLSQFRESGGREGSASEYTNGGMGSGGGSGSVGGGNRNFLQGCS